MLLDEVLENSRRFAAGRPAEPLPPVEAIRLAVVACYDPRLDKLLLPAMGLDPGQAFFLRTAGAFVRPSSGSLRSLMLAVFMFGVTEILVVGHTSCRMATFDMAAFIDSFRRRGVPRDAFGADDLREWVGAISDPKRGVEMSVANIRAASFAPRDLVVSGAVLDDTTGRIEMLIR